MRELAILLCVISSGCTSGAGSPGGPISGSIQLSAGRATTSSKIGVAPSDPSTLFASVEITLANGTDEAAPLVGAAFHLATQNGLEVYGDPTTALHPRGCQQTAAVSPGATVSCVVVFRVAPGAVPIRVSYHLMGTSGDSVSTEISDFVPCTKCGSDCVDLHGDDPDNCGGCGVQVGMGTCEAGKTVCQSGSVECGGTCLDLLPDSHCMCEPAPDPTGFFRYEYICEPPSDIDCAKLCGGLECVGSLGDYRCTDGHNKVKQLSCGKLAAVISDAGSDCTLAAVYCLCD